MTRSFKFSFTALGVAALIGLSGAAQAQVVLKASHQFPGGKGDVRDEMVQMIARDVAAANVGMVVAIVILCIFPEIATWLPKTLMG